MTKPLQPPSNYRFQLCIACLAMATSISASAFAQTKQETKEFLIKKANWTSPGNRLVKEPFVNRLWFEDDVLVIRSTRPKDAKKDKNDETIYWENRVPLANLNPKRIEMLTFEDINECDVKFAVNPDRGNIKFRSSIVVPTVEREKSNATFSLPDKQTATQCAKALERLVMLSGGKPELFE